MKRIILIIGILLMVGWVSAQEYSAPHFAIVSAQGSTNVDGMRATWVVGTILGGGVGFSLAYGSATPVLSSSQLELKVYPNPASSYVRIALTQHLPQGLRMRLFNVLGEAVCERPFTQSHLQLSVADLPNGLYLIGIFDAQGSQISTSTLVIKR